MSKRGTETLVVYHGSLPCQAKKACDGKACTNMAYYKEGSLYLCGVHSDTKKRTQLPKDKDEKRRKLTLISEHQTRVEEKAKNNVENGLQGFIQCQKMKMMKEVPLVEDFTNVFPNNKHENRIDGIGCASLSPMRLGPVVHRQRGLKNALNIENYHQFNKVWPSEVDKDGDPSKEWQKRQKEGYADPEPHRHKFSAKEMSNERKAVNGKNRNQPLYSVHRTIDGKERRFSYVESRYFYCKAYEALAPKSPQFETLLALKEKGTNLMICGYDACPITRPIYDHYCDATHPFGHELVLYCLLTIGDENDYPWNRYEREHLDLYKDIAYVL